MTKAADKIAAGLGDASKGRARLSALEPLVTEAAALDFAAAGTILADAERALKRAIKRAETLPAEFERIELVPTRGPVVEFSGRQIAEDSYQTKGADPLDVVMEVWETRGGAIVGMRSAMPAGRDGFEIVDVAVAEPRDDVDAMRAEIMDLFDWHVRAKSMMRKQAGWSFRREVE